MRNHDEKGRDDEKNKCLALFKESPTFLKECKNLKTQSTRKSSSHTKPAKACSLSRSVRRLQRLHYRMRTGNKVRLVRF